LTIEQGIYPASSVQKDIKKAAEAMYTQCFKNTRKLEQYKGLKIKDSMEVEYTQKGQFDKHMLCVPEGFGQPWYAN